MTFFFLLLILGFILEGCFSSSPHFSSSEYWVINREAYGRVGRSGGKDFKDKLFQGPSSSFAPHL